MFAGSTVTVHGQVYPVKVVVTVTPPYPVSVSYYTDHPEQVLVQVINLGRLPQSFRLVGSINGLDNNVKVVSKNRGASEIITLNALESRSLTTGEIQDLFDARKLSFTGFNYRQSQFDDALPEGQYNICLFAVDPSRTTVQLSEQSCSNAFRVSNLEPPMIISPMADITIPAMPVQNTIFTWTMPAGAPPTTEYTIRMVEVVPGMNINQAILAATTPVFFERTVSINTLLYGPADPPLVPGRRYAFVVAAKDGMGRAVFRNNGRSAVQSFVYGASQPVSSATAPAKAPDLSGDKVVTKGLSNLNATVKGRLTYAFPEDYTWPAFVDPPPNTKAVPWKESDQKVYLSPSHFTSVFKKRQGGGVFEYEYHSQALKPVANIFPMKKAKVSLVEVYAFHQKEPMFPGVISYDVGDGWRVIAGFTGGDEYAFLFNGKNVKGEPLTKVLDSRTTGDNGEFVFSFPMKDTCGLNNFQTQTKTQVVDNGTYWNETTKQYEPQSKTIGSEKSASVTLHKVCVLVVESPYFCSPFTRIYARPGDNIVLPDQLSLAKTFQARIYAINDASVNQAGGGNYAVLEGISMELFRMKPVDGSMPRAEGQNLPAAAISSLNMGSYSNAYPISQVDRVVAIDKTNSAGYITTSRLLRGQYGKFKVHAYTPKNIGVYNKMDIVEEISESGEHADYYPDNGISPYLVFNGGYPYERIVTSVEMLSKNPRIAGKVVEDTKGLSGVQVHLLQGGIWHKEITTQADGSFEFNDLQPGEYWMMFVKDGYNKKIFGAPDVKDAEFSFKDIKTFSLQKGQLLQTNDIRLIPSSILTGVIKDEDGNQVVCDVQLEDGAFYKTQGNTGVFEIPAQTGTGLKFNVFPRSDEYMDETFNISVSKTTGKQVNSTGVLKVYRNRHRARFNVVKKTGNTQLPFPDAKVVVNGNTQYTDEKGQVVFQFESPGEIFLVRVTPPKNSTFAHWEEEMVIPVSKTVKDYTVALEAGKTLAITVTEFVRGNTAPSKNAKVYIKRLNNAWDDNPSNYTEATTDDKGFCQLTGIPANEKTVEVFVSKDPDGKGSYTSASQYVSLPAQKTVVPVQLKLSYLPGFAVNTIWGMPVQLESIKSLGNDTYSASGSFINLPGNVNFDVLDPKTRIDFKDVVFVKNSAPPTSTTTTSPGQSNRPFSSSSLTVVNQETHIPKEGAISTLQNDMAIKVSKKLQGHAFAYGSSAKGSPRLFIRKSPGGKGLLKAAVQLDLASFKGAYQLAGDISLGSDKTSPVVDVLSADSYPKQKFFVGQSSGTSGSHFENLQYSVHGFDAEADVARSYVYGDSVNLFTILHTNIPSMTPGDLNIQAGYITILPDQIVPFDGGDNLSFSLEKWKVMAQKKTAGQPSTITLNGVSTTVNTGAFGTTPAWYYDKNNGGIVIPQVLVNTGIIGVSLRNLIVKPDRLIADKLELDKADAAALSLGGVVPLSVFPSTQIAFTYDPNCYHDNKPHWKLSLLNPQGKAAEVKNLDGLEDGQAISFESMNLFSDNQQQLSGPSFKTLIFKKILSFSPAAIDVGADYFTLVGDASFNIPNLSNGGKKVSGQVTYSKGANGKAVFSHRPFYFDIEAAGKVTFQATDQASTQTLESGRFTADGTLNIYDDKSKKSFQLKGKLLHQKIKNGFDTYIEIPEGQRFPLAGKYLDIKSGIASSGMRVQNGNWQTMALSAVLPTGPQGFQMLQDDEKYRSLRLLVKGAIETDPSTGVVGLKGMDTGMSNLSLYYIFERGELYGNFYMNPAMPINAGVVNITSGNVSMAIGENGVYMINNGTGQLALPGGIPLPLDVTVSTVAGYYTMALPAKEMDIIRDLAVQKTLPDFMAAGIKGSFASATATITPLDKDYDITGDEIPDGIANVRAYAYAGLSYELRNYVNFRTASNFDLFSGLYGYGAAKIGGEATILGCGPSAEVGFDVQLAATQSASPSLGLSLDNIKNTIGSMTLNGCGSVGANVRLEVCARFLGCLGFTLEKHISLHFQASPPVGKSASDALDIWFTLDDCGNAAPVKKIQSAD
jgi:TANFOR domain-containing protein